MIIVRKRLVEKFKRKFKFKGEIIVLDVTDSKRLAPVKFKNLSHNQFQKKWTRPQLRKALKNHKL